MSALSLTGLLATKPKKSAVKCTKGKSQIHLRALGMPAPYTLRPFAGLYNPFPYGCSLLCNHPADNDAKDVLKKAKDTWATEGKSLLLAEEIAAIRAGLEQVSAKVDTSATSRPAPPVESVPEELFRKYTDTDSRPMTPAPTIISAYTRASGSRRCFTPDPIPTAEVRERTLLILDLRRSHSQDTLSWQGSAIQHETPLIRIHHSQTPNSTSESWTRFSSDNKKRVSGGHGTLKPSKSSDKNYLEVQASGEDDQEVTSNQELSEGEEDIVKRRGKKRKKRGRDSSRGPPAFQSTDPETQVAALDADSFSPSARGSLVPGSRQDPENYKDPEKGAAIGDAAKQAVLDSNSYLDSDILKHLRRELNEEIIDLEFDFKKRIALEEAKKTLPPELKECEELKVTREEISIPQINSELLLTTPRLLVRAGVRFELPMDTRTLNTMTPLEYVKNHCSTSKERKYLYNYIFNQRQMVIDETNLRKLEAVELVPALGEMMGKPLKTEQIEKLRAVLGWKDEDIFDFQTFCGICGFCERYLGSEFCPPLPPKLLDQCHAIEKADFESLHRRLIGHKPDERLIKMLYHLRDK